MKIAFSSSATLTSDKIPEKESKDIIFNLTSHNIFARGVEFKGTDTNTWRDITINGNSLSEKPLQLVAGDNITISPSGTISAPDVICKKALANSRYSKLFTFTKNNNAGYIDFYVTGIFGTSRTNSFFKRCRIAWNSLTTPMYCNILAQSGSTTVSLIATLDSQSTANPKKYSVYIDFSDSKLIKGDIIITSYLGTESLDITTSAVTELPTATYTFTLSLVTANVSNAQLAENSNKLGGKALSELLTNFSLNTTTNNLAITVGGTSKAVTLNYAAANHTHLDYLDLKGQNAMLGPIVSLSSEFFRSTYGNYGIMHVNTGSKYQILVTKESNALGNANTDIPTPFSINLKTGKATIYGNITNSQLSERLLSSTTSITDLNNPTQYADDVVGLVLDTYAKGTTNSPIQVDNANALLTILKGRNGTATQYTNLLAFSTNNEIYTRYSKGGTTATWGNWVKLLTSVDFDTAYWANVKISNISSTTTAPVFGLVTIGGLLVMGGMLALLNDGSNLLLGQGNKDSLQTKIFGKSIQMYALDTSVLLITEDGKVGIKNTNPTYDVDISGSLHSSGVIFTNTRYDVPENTVGINYSSGLDDKWSAWTAYETAGSLALIFGTLNYDTSIMFINNENYNSIASNRFLSLTPGLAIKGNSVFMGVPYSSMNSATYRAVIRGKLLTSGFYHDLALSGYTSGDSALLGAGGEVKWISKTGNVSGRVPAIDTSLRMFVGSDIYFVNSGVSTYTTRLKTYSSASRNTITLPKESGILALQSSVTTVKNSVDSLLTLVDGLNGYLQTDTLIDCSTLDSNTWYPVVFPLNTAKSSYNNIRMECNVALNSNKPSWCSHSSGFSVKLVWESSACGWGTVPVDLRVLTIEHKWIKTHSDDVKEADLCPVRGLTYAAQGSHDVLYVRGGGQYYFFCTHGVVPELHTTTWTPNSSASETFPTYTMSSAYDFAALSSYESMRKILYEIVPSNKRASELDTVVSSQYTTMYGVCENNNSVKAYNIYIDEQMDKWEIVYYNMNKINFPSLSINSSVVILNPYERINSGVSGTCIYLGAGKDGQIVRFISTLYISESKMIDWDYCYRIVPHNTRILGKRYTENLNISDNSLWYVTLEIAPHSLQYEELSWGYAMSMMYVKSLNAWVIID